MLKRMILLALLLSCLCAAALAEETEWPFAVQFGSKETNMVAITMDDCGNESIVEQTFRFCVANEVNITFFPIGVNLLEQNPELWREIALSPWVEIGCHTQHHYCWEKCRHASIDRELDEFQATLDTVLGFHYPVQQVRPPHGHYKKTAEGGDRHKVQEIIAAHGYEHVILWSINDTDPAPVLRKVHGGSIMLFHAYAKDMRCIKGIVPELKKRGLEPVTISTLLGMEKPVPDVAQ